MKTGTGCLIVVLCSVLFLFSLDKHPLIGLLIFLFLIVYSIWLFEAEAVRKYNLVADRKSKIRENVDRLRESAAGFISSLEESPNSIIASEESEPSSIPTTISLLDIEGKTCLTTDVRYSGIILSWRQDGDILHNVYRSDEILDCEIIEDGVAVANSAAQLGGAALGGVLFGGAGAVVGAVASRQKTNSVNELSLKINVNDYDHPYWLVRLHAGTTIPKTSEQYEGMLSEVRHWHGRLVVIKSGANAGTNTHELSESELPSLTNHAHEDVTKEKTRLFTEGQSVLKAYEELSSDSPNYEITRGALRDRYESIRRELADLKRP